MTTVNYYGEIHAGKAAFFQRLEAAWDFGQDFAVSELGERCRPYDLVLGGVWGIITNVLWHNAQIDLFYIHAMWGEYLGRVPSNADPITVFRDLRVCYPSDFGRLPNERRDSVSKQGIHKSIRTIQSDEDSKENTFISNSKSRSHKQKIRW